MNYFESLLEKRGYQECPLPLWKLKITDEEFEELRKILKKCAIIEHILVEHKYSIEYLVDLLQDGSYDINTTDTFGHHLEECALFFSEYWRRLYDGGPHKKKICLYSFDA